MESLLLSDKTTLYNLQVLRECFALNNSPSKTQMEELCSRLLLPLNVIKCWFRNTLFKARQHDEHSPFNFNTLPSPIGLNPADPGEMKDEARIVLLTTNRNNLGNETTKPLCSYETDCDKKPQHQVADQSTALHRAQNKTGMPTSITPVNPSVVGQSGSRLCANRPCFTDYQLKSLRMFYKKQAYPKNHDLEDLSKKLQLLPCTILAWFANKRHKARRISKIRQNVKPGERFIRTAGRNYQCKRCWLVFRRYFNLIRHQHKHCYKNKAVQRSMPSSSISVVELTTFKHTRKCQTTNAIDDNGGMDDLSRNGGQKSTKLSGPVRASQPADSAAMTQGQSAFAPPSRTCSWSS